MATRRGRMFSIQLTKSVTVPFDIIEINVQSDEIIVIHAMLLATTSEIGDSEAEGFPVLFHAGTTSGSGGSSPVAAKLQNGTFGYSGSIEVNNTTLATEGDHLYSGNFHTQQGFSYRPTPRERIMVSPSSRFVATWTKTPTDILSVEGTILFEVIGG